MQAVDKQEARQALDALQRALEGERFRHVAGLEPEPALARLFRDHSRAAHKETVAALRDQGEIELAHRVAELRAERAMADDEEAWRAAESRAQVKGPDGLVSLTDAVRTVVRERDRERRLALGRAIADGASACGAFREAALEKRARSRAESGLTSDWEAVSQGDQLLVASADAYRDVLGWLARRYLGLSPLPQGDLTRADLLHLLALPAYDGLFPAGMLVIALRKAAQGLGLDLDRIRIDDAERPAQWPGAHAIGTRVSLRRLGGVADWLDLFRAVGEAIAAAHAPPHLRQPALAPALGTLLQELLLTPAFLGRVVGIDRKHVADIVRALALRRLFQLRAHAAAQRVAAEVERGMSGAAWHEAHREALSAAALASWPRGLAARDGDAGAHCRALAGAAWAERLRRDFAERYDEDFWRNPRAAAAIAGLVASGQMGPENERPPLGVASDALVRRMETGK